MMCRDNLYLSHSFNAPQQSRYSFNPWGLYQHWILDSWCKKENVKFEGKMKKKKKKKGGKFNTSLTYDSMK